MMDEHIVRWSVQDVIRILQSAPVSPDMIPEVTITQVVNRAPTAHLSIEKTLKFLISKAGGSPEEHHHLHTHLTTLRQHDPCSGAFLDKAFSDATQFYGLNANVRDLKHLKSLDSYLSMVGTADAFHKMRYWELDQSKDAKAISRVWLPLHLEIVYALRELLFTREKPRRTIMDRVEDAVRAAMLPNGELWYGPGTPRENSVNAYITWIQQHGTCKTALQDAIQNHFAIGDQMANDIVKKAYETLSTSQDPAVQYLTVRLDVLPPQPRDVTPPVEWIGPEKERHGIVKTPGGYCLGYIDRSSDGVWHITPSRNGVVRVSARTETQTDARYYLTQLLTAPATVTVDNNQKPSRLVGEKYDLFQRNYQHSQHGTTAEPVDWSHKLTFWDETHGITVHQQIKVEVQDSDFPDVINILEGQVTDAAGSEIYIVGAESVEMTASED